MRSRSHLISHTLFIRLAPAFWASSLVTPTSSALRIFAALRCCRPIRTLSPPTLPELQARQMPRELRKRKAPALELVALEPKPPTKRKKKGAVVEASVTKSPSPSPTATPSPKPAKARATRESKSTTAVSVGQTISVDEFGGEIETNEGAKTTLAKLLDASDGGVVLFTYPKASTPGCIKQACLFRDRYTALTATGFAIYGLSRDSPKANSTFQTKQSLPYPLLCDPKATLITAIGMKKAPAGTKRGVFVVDKSGKVLALETGGPGATVDIVQNLVDNASVDDSPDEQADAAPEERRCRME